MSSGIGSYWKDDGGPADAGFSYVLLGGCDGTDCGVETGLFAALAGGQMSLADAGASLMGEAPYDSAGFSVCRAGDVNGDDLDDLLIGAPSLNQASETGRAYLVYGVDP